MNDKTTKNRKVILAFWTVIILTAAMFIVFLSPPAATASANMGPPPPLGENSGIVFEVHDVVKVDSQILNINFISDNNAQITAIYTMTNTSNEAISVKSMFLSPIYWGQPQREYEITANGTALEYSQTFFGYLWSNLTADDLLNWREILAENSASDEPKEHW